MNKRQRRKLAKRLNVPAMIRRAYANAMLDRVAQARGVPFTVAEMDALMARIAA